eukprot:6376391-Amphidinium_carterae.1
MRELCLQGFAEVVSLSRDGRFVARCGSTQLVRMAVEVIPRQCGCFSAIAVEISELALARPLASFWRREARLYEAATVQAWWRQFRCCSVSHDEVSWSWLLKKSQAEPAPTGKALCVHMLGSLTPKVHSTTCLDDLRLHVSRSEHCRYLRTRVRISIQRESSFWKRRFLPTGIKT